MKKNIIFITADQLGANFIGAYGSGVNSTPTLDSLANEGVRFDRCYASYPVCTPNRAIMLTGRSDEICGMVGNNLVLQDDCPTIAHVLSQAGYKTGGFGKFHQTPMQFPLPDDLKALGFSETALTEDTKLGQWLDEIKKNHPNHYEAALAVSWPMPYLNEYGENKEDLTESYIKASKNLLDPMRKDNFRIMYTSPLPAELHQTSWITDKSLEFIEKHKDEPFFCNISYVDPHDPYDPPKPYDTMFNPSDMPLPIKPAWKERGNSLFESHVKPYGVPVLYDDYKSIQKLRALYHGSIRFIDDQIKRVVEYLKSNNLWDNTIIIFTTDHGDMMLDHDLITKGVMHYDSGTRCPLIISGGGVEKNVVSDRLTCTLDFCPTICDLTETINRPLYEGRSFARLLLKPLFQEIISRYTVFKDKSYKIEQVKQSAQKFYIDKNGSRITETTYKTLEFWDSIAIQSNGLLRSIITNDGYRLTIYDSEDNINEMFNLKDDPKEQNNLFYKPEYKDKKIELMEKHIKAFIPRTKLPQYRNLMYKDNQKWQGGMGFNYFPAFTMDKDR